MSKKTEKQYYGGQAVIEGVMMRGKKSYALAVRNTQTQEISTVSKEIKARSKFFGVPILRGVVSFVDSLVNGVKTIYESAEMAGLDDLEEENPTKFEKWLQDKFGDKLFGAIIFVAVAFAIVFSVGLFMALPAFLASFITPLLNGQNWAIGIIEGLTRLALFIAYLGIISGTKDVKRLYAYHGAEHKTINCYEAGDELTVENVKKRTRLHKRCGTSFLLIVMLVSMVIFFFIRTETVWLRVLSRVLLVPVIAGLSYEIIRWAGRHDGVLVDIISAPGLALQRMTTKEPDDSQIEVAIAALSRVLGDDKGESCESVKSKGDENLKSKGDENLKSKGDGGIAE